MKIKENLATMQGKFRYTMYKPDTDEVIYQSEWQKNNITRANGHGYNLVLRALRGDNTYPVEITGAKIGTGTGAPSNTDTNLQNALQDSGSDLIVPVGNSVIVNNVLTLSFFISNAELPNDVYSEWGIFAGSQLFARALLVPAYDKNTGADSRFEHVIELT